MCRGEANCAAAKYGAELTAWIQRAEEHLALYRLQSAIFDQINRLGTQSPAAIAAALGEMPERIAEVLRDYERRYRGQS